MVRHHCHQVQRQERAVHPHLQQQPRQPRRQLGQQRQLEQQQGQRQDQGRVQQQRHRQRHVCNRQAVVVKVMSTQTRRRRARKHVAPPSIARATDAPQQPAPSGAKQGPSPHHMLVHCHGGVGGGGGVEGGLHDHAASATNQQPHVPRHHAAAQPPLCGPQGRRRVRAQTRYQLPLSPPLLARGSPQTPMDITRERDAEPQRQQYNAARINMLVLSTQELRHRVRRCTIS